MCLHVRTCVGGCWLLLIQEHPCHCDWHPSLRQVVFYIISSKYVQKKARDWASRHRSSSSCMTACSDFLRWWTVTWKWKPDKPSPHHLSCFARAFYLSNRNLNTAGNQMLAFGPQTQAMPSSPPQLRVPYGNRYFDLPCWAQVWPCAGAKKPVHQQLEHLHWAGKLTQILSDWAGCMQPAEDFPLLAWVNETRRR